MIFRSFLAIVLITTTACARTAEETETSSENLDEESGEKPPIPAAELRSDAENRWRTRHDADWVRADSFLVYQVNGDPVVVGDVEQTTMEVLAPDGIAAAIQFTIDGFGFKTNTDESGLFPTGGAADPEPGTYPCADFNGKLELKAATGAVLKADPAACAMTIDRVTVDRPEFPASLHFKPRKI